MRFSRKSWKRFLEILISLLSAWRSKLCWRNLWVSLWRSSRPAWLCLFQCSATIVILCIGETHNLINYVSFINYLSYGVTIAGLLYYRWKKPNLYRPIKVPTPQQPRAFTRVLYLSTRLKELVSRHATCIFFSYDSFYFYVWHFYIFKIWFVIKKNCNFFENLSNYFSWRHLNFSFK